MAPVTSRRRRRARRARVRRHPRTRIPPRFPSRCARRWTASRAPGAGALAPREAARVRALVVGDIAPQGERKGVDHIRQFVTANDELDTFEDFVARAHAFNPRRSLENIRDRLRHNLRRLPTGRWTWKYDPTLRDPGRAAGDIANLWDRVREIRCPTLIIRGGESDVLAPETAARPRGLVHAEVRTVAGAGHSVMGDNPAGFLAAVEPFLTTLERA